MIWVAGVIFIFAAYQVYRASYYWRLARRSEAEGGRRALLSEALRRVIFAALWIAAGVLLLYMEPLSQRLFP